MTLRHVVLALAIAAPALAAEHAGGPIALSPGGSDDFRLVPSRCQTFSWSQPEGATGYELLVYRFEGSDSSDTERNQTSPSTLGELRVQLPAGSSSWTASGEDCFASGGHYAWTVRAVTGDTASDWAAPKLFRLSPEPSADAVRQALRTLREKVSSLEATAAGTEPPRPAAAPSDDVATTGRSTAKQPRKDAGTGSTPGVHISPSSITIGGASVVTTLTDQDSLGDLSCADGELVVHTPSGWGCISQSSLPRCDSGDLISCYGGDPSTLDVGECVAGTRFCNGSGSFDACSGDVTPVTEICDALDNDCDGALDNGFECIEGTTVQCGVTDIGPCQYGTKSCSSCLFGPCIGNIDPSPSPDVCDGQDTDCDGSTDEDADCVDSNDCTEDACGGVLGCTHTNLTGTPCMGGMCQDGVCMP